MPSTTMPMPAGLIIAAVTAHSRNYHISEAGKSAEGIYPTPHSHSEPDYLRHSPCDERSAGVISVAETCADSRSKCDDVFQRAAKLYALNVVIRIYAHTGVHKCILHCKRCLVVLARRNY